MKTLLAAGALALAGTTAFATCDDSHIQDDGKWAHVYNVHEGIHWVMFTEGYGNYTPTDNPWANVIFSAANAIMDICDVDIAGFSGAGEGWHDLEELGDTGIWVGYLDMTIPED